MTLQDDREPERFYDWILWKMRQEDCKLKDVLMSPLEDLSNEQKEIHDAIEKRITELEDALRAERNTEVNNH